MAEDIHRAVSRISKSLAEVLDQKEEIGAELLTILEEKKAGLQEQAAEFCKNIALRMEQKWQGKSEQITQIGKVLGSYLELRLMTLAANIKATPLYDACQCMSPEALMEPPECIKAGNAYSGDPVYYINGIWTLQDSALESAQMLADRLQRPVYLIYNPSELNPPDFQTGTPGLFGDIGEAIYDSVWPLITCAMTPEQLEKPAERSIQLNPTTRKVTHLLYYSDRPVSVVTHSQGCIIVRNACFALFLLGKEQWVEDNLAWVATGIPLHENEVWPKPSKYTSLVHKDDPIPGLIGLHGIKDIDASSLIFKHGFKEHYLDMVDPSMLWPSSIV
jgi:hypothetical protein